MVCDKCGKTNGLTASIGYLDKDICLKCAYKVTKYLVNKPPTSPRNSDSKLTDNQINRTYYMFNPEGQLLRTKMQQDMFTYPKPKCSK